MKVVFIHMGNKGHAAYDPSEETYSWEYQGDEKKITRLLSDLEDGRNYTKMVTHGAYANSEDDKYIPNEEYVLMTWSEHIEELAMMLRRAGADVLYVGDG